MSGRSAVLAISIISDSRQARRDLNTFGNDAQRSTGKLSKLAVPAAAAVAGLGLVGKAALDSASDLQQSTGAAQSVFGKYAGSIIKNGKAAAAAVGLSQSAFQTQAVLLGSQLKNLGQPMDKVAGTTDALIKKAADLAATFGGPTSDAVEAISSLMRGESDPIERYGVSINQAAVQAFELAHHLDTSTTAAAKNAKRTAILALLYKQTTAATGQFRREATSAAGAQEIANAKFENAKAALGTRLLPVYAQFKTILSSILGWISKNSSLVFKLAAGLGALAVAILIANGALKVYRLAQGISLVLSGEAAAATGAQAAALAVQKTALAISTAAQWAFNAAMAANPIVLLVLAIAALIAILVLVIVKVKPVRDFFAKTLPAAFHAFLNGAKSVWTAAVAFFRKWGPVALAVLVPFIGIPLLIFKHFDKIRGWLAGIWAKVTGGARSFVGNIVDTVASIPGRIGRLAGSFLNAGKNVIGSFFSGIANGAKSVGSWAVDAAKTLVNAIIGGLNKFLHLPWTLKIHIPIKFAPDINVGPYTIMPSIPLWASAGGPSPWPASPSLDRLAPGWSLMAMAAGFSAPVSVPSSRGDSGTVVQDVRVTFTGLVTDPDATARQIQTLLDRRASRIGQR